jgi:uncharacterized membrane protein (DUF4010 family)
MSYGLVLFSTDQLLPWAIGFGTVGALAGLSYYHKLRADPSATLTTEVSALVTYTIGGLIGAERYWIAATLGVLSVLLLELKKTLENVTRYVSPDEIVTVAKFLMLSVVILPILPDRDFTEFHLNPYKTWLVVVAVSGVSFASYVVQRLLTGRGGLLIAAILGGAYSSTVTTVVLARQARHDDRPHRFAGAILTASAIMYVRLLVLVALFELALAQKLGPAFAGLAVVGTTAGLLVYLRREGAATSASPPADARNPLELRAAFLFAALFVAIEVVTRLASRYLGRAGIYALAAMMGVSDVDPFILGLTQASSGTVSTGTAVIAIVIAAASNDLIKAIYAYAFARGRTGRLSLGLLLAYSALGLVPILWLGS